MKVRVRTEEHILKDDGLLRKSAEVAMLCPSRVWHRLLLDPRPSQVYVEEQQEHTETYYRRFELVSVSHQGVMQQMSVDLASSCPVSALCA